MPNNSEETGLDDVILVDCRLMKCPLPVLRAQKVWKILPPGRSMRVLATDPNASADMQKLADHHSFTYGESTDADGVLIFDITRPDN